MERAKKMFLFFLILGFVIVFFHSTAIAQFWVPIEPYNVLWPNWTGANNYISPPPELLPTTILTDMPVWVWDGSSPGPFFLYNIPPVFGGSLNYWDAWTGFNVWPPPSLAAAPITWDLTTPSLIPPWTISAFALAANQANLSYEATTTGFFGAVPFSSLLTPSQIWGIAPFTLPNF